jgi:polyhydroxybutyrate depolymerase
VLSALVAATLVVTPTACSSAPAEQPALTSLHSGDNDLEVNVQGDSRPFRLYVAKPLVNKKRLPLVLVLHGGGGSGPLAEWQSVMDPVADANRFLLAYPTGVSGALGGTWNAGDCCGLAMRQNADDVGFISALLDLLVGDGLVDSHRVYATGMSNGAMMVYRLACELASKIVAIAPVEGALMVDPCTPSRAVSVMIFHGTADTQVPEEGGWNPLSDARRAFPPLQATVQAWLTIDQLGEPTEVTYQRGGATCLSSDHGLDGTELVVCRIVGGGHQWPGGNEVSTQRAGPISRDINASAEMWKFFSRHIRVDDVNQ